MLNINELANALKPVFLPGEEMTVSIVKEGKESNQGVGYLDDGTMVVVDGAGKAVGQMVPVIVGANGSGDGMATPRAPESGAQPG